ncbi:unnamed protein product [Vitrella brassicaformis CCMP3155]|uniref:Uncharacterized protein n=1 Tax=Vitrella brassicaformis (strain CCMP3155) TaxID=1169540 RepID=A0A0G4EK91_VITBC|nr:unnamed protein product [Vitrella brassicaformis CCMP3155]|eukprot:CEL97865.1 unnamed protein product [Vitrella brassicaformis CCMP3155]
MAGYKVRMDASTADPEMELQQCIVCGKRPEPGQRFHVCSRCVREVSPRYCSEACLRQYVERGRHTRAMCERGRKLYVYDLRVRGNPHAVKYLLGWMSEDSFFKRQRQKQQAILREIEDYGHRTEVAVSPEVASFETDRLYCLVAMSSLSTRGHPDRQPPCDTGALLYDKSVVYPSYQLFPLTAPNPRLNSNGPPRLSPELSVLCGQRVAAVLSTTIAAFLDMAARGLPVAVYPFINCDNRTNIVVDVLFWRKILCRVPDHGNCRSVSYLFDLTPYSVVICAVSFAASRVFGKGKRPSEKLLRDEWRKEIEWEINNIKGLPETIDRICHELALQRDSQPRKLGHRKQKAALNAAVSQLKADFLEAALAYTDQYRRNVIEYIKPGLIDESLAEVTGMTEAEVQRIEAEVGKAEFMPYTKRLMAAVPPAYAPELDGPLVTLADGKQVCEADLLLSTQEFI